MWYQCESAAHLGFFILCCIFLVLKREEEEEQQKIDVLLNTSINRKYWRQILC